MSDETDPELQALWDRYHAALHGVQTGVEYARQFDPSQIDGKHMRTGLNAARSDQGALGRLLIAKGLISERELVEALVEGIEAERAMYEQLLMQHYGGGTKITLR